jgi:hypothetical protein
MTAHPYTETPLETIKSAFAQMRAAPAEMSLRLPPVPIGPVNRVMNLEQIHGAIHGPGIDPAVRCLVWGAVIRKARRRETGWFLVAAGFAYPKLVHKARLLAANFAGDTVEDQADLIEAFLKAVCDINVEDRSIPDLGAMAAWRAYSAVRRKRRRELAAPVCVPLGSESAAPAPVVGHPDILLARAVRLGVISAAEAEYIGRSYLEDTPIDEILAWARIPRATFFRYRAAAETRLVEAIRGGLL